MHPHRDREALGPAGLEGKRKARLHQLSLVTGRQVEVSHGLSDPRSQSQFPSVMSHGHMWCLCSPTPHLLSSKRHMHSRKHSNLQRICELGRGAPQQSAQYGAQKEEENMGILPLQ